MMGGVRSSQNPGTEGSKRNVMLVGEKRLKKTCHSGTYKRKQSSAGLQNTTTKNPHTPRVSNLTDAVGERTERRQFY